MWVNGEGPIEGFNGGVTYAGWFPDEPNDCCITIYFEDNEENFLGIGRFGGLGWNDEGYSVVGGYVVEYERSTIPIDIKPGENPNIVHLDSSGRVPVAMLSGPGFSHTDFEYLFEIDNPFWTSGDYRKGKSEYLSEQLYIPAWLNFPVERFTLAISADGTFRQSVERTDIPADSSFTSALNRKPRRGRGGTSPRPWRCVGGRGDGTPIAPMQKLIPICPRKKCVIPLGQSWVLEIVQAVHLLVGDFNVGGILFFTQGALHH